MTAPTSPTSPMSPVPERSGHGTLAFAWVLIAVLASLVAWLVASHTEWATAAVDTAVVCFVLACLTLLAVLLRSNWRGGRGLVTLGLAAVVVLAALGGLGLASTGRLHRAQARALEAGGQWTQALAEYRLAGETPPGSADLARVYAEWGEQLLHQGHFAGARTAFRTVLDLYQSGTGALTRAATDLVRVDTLWVQSASASVPYTDILPDLDGMRGKPYCDASCVAAVATIEPQALYQYGVALDQHTQYGNAAGYFGLVVKNFPNSAYAAGAYRAAASSLLAQARAELIANCIAAVGFYQQLVSTYPSAPAAATARAALAQPGSAAGALIKFPTNPTPTVYLSLTAAPLAGGGYTFSDDYSSAVDPSSGAFAFPAVTPGHYVISVGLFSWQAAWVTSRGTPPPLLTYQIGPICPIAMGTLNY